MSTLQNTSKRLLLYFCRAPSSKAASNAVAKSCQINWRIERIKTFGSIYFLNFWFGILQSQKLMSWKTFTLQYLELCFRFFKRKYNFFFTFITLNPRGRSRSIFRRNVKTKAWKDLFSIWFQKETTRNSIK